VKKDWTESTELIRRRVEVIFTSVYL